ncbi:Uncharacterised protein [Mycobacterium tuberculosis]|uniref:Uncharacterized protein n=1 Tax=Mycobacterium tuberculosis TaxID=1773 RepID=A0A655JK57_MYCTX|nr:Uncharacterised protein [Mycobacterium tuberculosis]COX38597.1 Uncharacterised protein [Mycobacterium tuberculosis]COX47940.1 Uncharacterised protein [Mycobacterium tuberculosis]
MRVTGSPGVRSAAAAARRGSRNPRGTPVAARSNSTAPTNRSLDSSVSPWPASSLAISPWRQVWIGSPQPSTRKVHNPTRSGVNWPWKTKGSWPLVIGISSGLTRCWGSLGVGSTLARGLSVRCG